MEFKHYIITRFNVLFRKTEQKNWAERVEDKSFRIRNNEMWLNNRLELFELYCLPSVKGQTNKNFSWIILMSQNTPTTVVSKLGAMLPDFSYIITSSENMLDYNLAAHAMDELTPYEKDFVISTSLDSDDGLSKDYIDTVQNNINPIRSYINITKGVTVAHHRGFQYIGEREGRSVNHFRSYIEPRKEIKSVYHMSHGESKSDAPVINVECDARWLEVIHGDNCSNRFKRKRNDKTRPLEELADMFSLDKEKVKNRFELDKNGFVIDESWGRVL